MSKNRSASLKLAALFIAVTVISACTGASPPAEGQPDAGTNTNTQQPAPGTNTNTGSEITPPSEPNAGTKPDTETPPAGNDKVLMENNAFRLFEPVPDTEVPGTFTVRGEARVFEAAFSYSFEDGHNILAKGHASADQGAPEWGKFEFTISYEGATSPSGVLTLYEASAKDGSPVNELHIPLKLPQPKDEAAQ